MEPLPPIPWMTFSPEVRGHNKDRKDNYMEKDKDEDGQRQRYAISVELTQPLQTVAIGQSGAFFSCFFWIWARGQLLAACG